MTTHTATPGTPSVAEEARRTVPEFVRPGEHLMWIGGHQIPGSSGQTLTNIDPTTEEELASIHRGTADDVDAAVQAARRAFIDPSWAEIDPDRRGRLLGHVKQSGVGGEGGPEVLDAFTKHKTVLVAL